MSGGYERFGSPCRICSTGLADDNPVAEVRSATRTVAETPAGRDARAVEGNDGSVGDVGDELATAFCLNDFHDTLIT